MIDAPSAAAPPPLPRYLQARWLSAGCGLFAFAVVLVLRGRAHPDEVFQYLEPAYRAVHGYGREAWEWRDGVRNWFAPGLIALVLTALQALHLESPTAALAVIWAFGSAWHALGMLALFRIIERRAGALEAAVGTALMGTWLAYVLFAPRTLADSLTLPPLLWAIAFALRARDDGDFTPGLASGLALGLAVVLRTASGVFALPIGVSLLLARRGRATLGLVLGFALVLAALGALDLLTWGSFLHSLRAYLAFNRPGGPVAQKFGSEPFWWYVLPLGGMVPLVLIPAFVRGLRRPDLLAACWFTYFGVLELSAHKEARFLLPLLPLGMAIGAGPMTADLRRWVWPTRARRAAFAVAWLAMSVAAPLWQWTTPLSRDLLDAERATGDDPTLRGLLVCGNGNFGDGGYFYLHRDVPLDTDLPILETRTRILHRKPSHVITEDARYDPALAQAGYARWRSFGALTVWRI